MSLAYKFSSKILHLVAGMRHTLLCDRALEQKGPHKQAGVQLLGHVSYYCHVQHQGSQC